MPHDKQTDNLFDIARHFLFFDGRSDEDGDVYRSAFRSTLEEFGGGATEEFLRSELVKYFDISYAELHQGSFDASEFNRIGQRLLNFIWLTYFWEEFPRRRERNTEPKLLRAFQIHAVLHFMKNDEHAMNERTKEKFSVVAEFEAFDYEEPHIQQIQECFTEEAAHFTEG